MAHKNFIIITFPDMDKSDMKHIVDKLDMKHIVSRFEAVYNGR